MKSLKAKLTHIKPGKAILNSFMILSIVVSLIFVLANINKWAGPIVLDDNQIQAFQLAIALIGIFLNAHYQSKSAERQFQEERKKELRQQQLTNLNVIESWLDEVSSVIENITVLRELSPKDEQDGKLIISSDKIKPIEERLVRLATRGFTLSIKALNIGNKGLKTDYEKLGSPYRELVENVILVWLSLNNVREFLSSKLPDAESYPGISLTKAKGAIDRIRYIEINSD